MAKPPRLSAVRKLWANARIRYGGIIGVVVTVVGLVTDGFTYWDWFTRNWAWLIGLSHSPYFPWLVLLIVVTMLVIGIRQVTKAEAAASQADDVCRQKALAQVHEMLVDMTKLTVLLAESGRALRAAVIAEEALRQLKRTYDVTKEFVDAPMPVSPHAFRGHMQLVDSDNGEALRALKQWLNLDDVPVRPTLPTVEHGPGQDAQVLPEHNEEYLRKVRTHVAEYGEFLKRADNAVRELREHDRALENQITRERRRIYGEDQ